VGATGLSEFSGQFGSEVRERIAETMRQLEEARDSGDEYGVQVHSGRLETLRRLAVEHGVDPAEIEG
jgi:hypothetical protein